MDSLTTDPGVHWKIPFTSGKSTNVSFTVLGSSCVVRNVIREKSGKTKIYNFASANTSRIFIFLNEGK